jgi:pantoate--beta-alanine ligase
MNIVTKISDWQSLRATWQGKTVGFVPTMGNLHVGHMSLCDRSKQENDITVVSVFVNPSQFNQQSDFDLYPRTVEQDVALLTKHGVDVLFMPDAESMYPDNYTLRVSESNVALELEGEYRPGHFDGMLTVVLKLLNLAQPTRAYFGEKDYQQLLLVKKMVTALFLPVEIIPCETKRADDLLALSSRNTRLNPEQRERAALFPAILQKPETTETLQAELVNAGFKVDYVADKWDRRLAAVWIDDVRLIDNYKRS